MEKCLIHIQTPKGAYDFSLRKGLGLMALQAMKDSEEAIEFDCKKADCGICIVKVLKGMDHLSAPTSAEADFLRAMHADDDERLACQCRVYADVDLQVEF